MTSNEVTNESTTLLVVPPGDYNANNEPSQEQQQQQGKASFSATVANSMKTCMGTGTLALPFAAQQGGLLLNTVGLLGIAAWNLYAVQRLLQSLRLCQQLHKSSDNNNSEQQRPPSFVTSTFGKVAWLAFGEIGVHGLDVALVVLFFGIIVAYEGESVYCHDVRFFLFAEKVKQSTNRGVSQPYIHTSLPFSTDAILGFVQDTPVNTGVVMVDALIIAAIVGTLSLVPDMGYLAKISASGLAVLVLTFVTIAGYAFMEPPSHDASQHPTTTTTTLMNVWPENGMSGVSHWFGCVVFGFGVVPLTYNFYESMARPHQLIQASAVALTGTACLYVSIGCGLLMLYYPVEGDILEKLPTAGFVPLMIRLAMIVVVLFTAPLIVLPCGMILEGKLLPQQQSNKTGQAVIRYSICIVCALTSVMVPSFVDVLSFVGCFSVALVSFVVPPMLHISLVAQTKNSTTTDTSSNNTSTSTAAIILDVAMLLWGIAATVISSTYTFRKLFDDGASS